MEGSMMQPGNGGGGGVRQPRSGRDLYMVPVADRLNDQFRLVDTLVLSMTDSWAYLPPRAKHILWLKLASCDQNFLEQCGMPLENGMLLHWSMWPDDLGDYAQAVSLRSSRQQLEYLEPKNMALASAIRQAEMAENTARLQIQLAQLLLQLSNGGADATELAKLFSKNKFDRESIQTVLRNAEEAMAERLAQADSANHERRNNPPPHTPPPSLAEQFEEQSNQEVLPEGKCSECGIDCTYFVGEDEQGKYMIDLCNNCYTSIIEGVSDETIYSADDIDGLIETVEDPILTDEQLLELSESLAVEYSMTEDEYIEEAIISAEEGEIDAAIGELEEE